MNRRTYLKFFCVLVLFTFSFQLGTPVFAQRPDKETLKLVPANDVKLVSTSKLAQKAVSPELLARAKSGEVDTKEQSIYIVYLDAPPAARYRGGIAGLAPTSAQVTGDKKFNAKSGKSRTYIQYLDQERASFISKMNSKLNRNPNIRFEYKVAVNGFAAEMTLDEALQVASLPGVKKVVPDWEEYKQTDAGPAWMGADTIWDGTAAGVAPTMGEGMIAGIIDTGMNLDHPSFADVGADGYDHTNPWGAGNYTGWCDPNYTDNNAAAWRADHPGACNDKLIGAWSWDSYDLNGDDYGPEDCDGHGSHTGSTVAGNVVHDATIHAPTTDLTLPQISGVAPHANVIIYSVEGTPCGSLSGSAIMAAVEQVVIDGVDVVNYSIGGGNSSPWDGAEHWLAVREANILAVTSASNDGPDPATVKLPALAPWMMTVGASSHNRVLSNVLMNMSGGNTTPPADIMGEGLTGSLAPTPIVYAGDVEPANAGCNFVFTADVTGKIVACDHGPHDADYAGRVAKSQNVADSGGAGYILLTDESYAAALLVDSYAVPGMGISYADGQILKAWLHDGGTGYMAAIRGALAEESRGDIMAAFSSRGPNIAVPDLIKPDVTAPGRRIAAAIATDRANPNPPEFDVYQGTSMSSPHAAGAAILIRALHPTWTASEVQSALMTTALNNVSGDNVLKEDALTPADAFDMGAGRIDLMNAANAGLILDETAAKMEAANPATGGDPTTLNIASLGNGACVGSCSWTRTVKNPTGTAMDWTASTNAPDGVTVTVTPSTFNIAAGATQELTISIDVSSMPFDEWVFAGVVLSEDASQAPDAYLPIAVMPSSGNLPESIQIETRRSAGSRLLEGIQAIEITDLTVTSSGLTKATLEDRALFVDSDNSDMYDDLTDGVFWIPVTVPADATRLVAEIVASESPDLDLFVGTGSLPSGATEVSSSASGTAFEYVSISDPEPGTWWILVQSWAASAEGAEDALTLAYAVVTGDAGNLTAEESTGATSIPAGQEFDLRVFWDESTMAAGDYWYGAFAVGTDASNPGNIGTVAVDLARNDDDVTKTVDNATPALGDTLTYTITISPNDTQEDLMYLVTDTIPEGLTYVPGSATASEGTVNVFGGDTLMWTGTMPTAFGVEGNYIVTDSTTDGSCDTGFGGYVDLEGYGISTQSGISGDTDTWTAFSGQDPIQFYGIANTGISFTDDGFVFLNSTAGSEPWTNTDLPNAGDPNDLMAIFWNDMEVVYDQATNKGVSLATNGPGMSIVEYDDVQPYEGDGTVHYDFEAVLNSAIDNTPGVYEIVFAYGPQAGAPTSATIGVENQSGTSAAKYLFGDPSNVVTEGLMVCFDYDGPTFEPVTITYQVTVDQDASGTVTNSAAHVTSDIGSQNAYATVDVFLPSNYLLWTK